MPKCDFNKVSKQSNFIENENLWVVLSVNVYDFSCSIREINFQGICIELN